MKLATSALLFLSTVGLSLAADTDGTVTVTETCDDGPLVVACEWEASGRRQLLRGGLKDLKNRVAKDRALSLEMEEIECTLTYNGTEYTSPVTFPYDFMMEIREADGQDDFCIYIADGISFADIDVTAKLEVELKDVDGDAVYDDESLSISGCPSGARI
mmetsp:Transcript_78175/g.108630  ORF Transcript_78175/g.108630 Transcript_78175/m.108630 type:complete len:159 (-) Transcript_78175:281-757(-)